MREPAQNTVDYFSAPENYFWRWAEGGEVIEWVNGVTICYREELADLMKGMDEECLPPLSCILLVLSACHVNWKRSNDTVDILQRLIEDLSIPGDPGFRVHAKLQLHRALQYLNNIAFLPADLRTGKARVHLLATVFADAGARIMPGIVDEFSGGSLQEHILAERKKITLEGYHKDLKLIGDRTIPDAESLELQLRTGITEIPKPLPVVVPNPKPLDLLEELAAESKTAGISRLAKRIIAALNIPMHAQGSSDQPYGGISDITNRGSFDRLLLSELAHDDVLLMARLVNNEALYLRREEPPHNPKKQRVILIDTSIKMWGLPRVFAVTAGIACTLNTKHGEKLDTYLLGGDGFTAAGLGTKEEVVKTLEQVDNSLYCTGGLEKFLQTAENSEETDVILITHDAYVHSAVFQKLFAQAGWPISFIISVSRSGEMVFNEVVNNNIKKLSSAKFDLEELLLAPTPNPKKQKPKEEEIALPIFYQMEKQPLYLPTTGMRMTQKNIVHNYYSGLYGVTETQRLLHWPKRDTGAQELLRFIEAGEYCFGFENNVLLYLLVKCSMDRGVKLYKISPTATYLNEEFDIKADCKGPVWFSYFQHFFYVNIKAAYNVSTVVIDCKHPNKVEYNKGLLFDDMVKKSGAVTLSRSFNEYKKFINNGYNVFHRVHDIYINDIGGLMLDNNELNIGNSGTIVWEPQKNKVNIRTRSYASPEVNTFKSNQHLWYRKYTWPDGSTAVVDANGLLHLKSANNNLPEITIVMVLNKPTACWTRNGFVCGSQYFVDLTHGRKILGIEFMEKFVRPFIDNLSKK